ncbi:MAG TPA: MgtC/SapB family protein, partial [Beijerinckiaceae bacterium]|nr:MgtC/SapB family protein [Beijerinckiaceae bacterium]
MTTGHLGSGEVLLRLGLAAIAGTVVGINRGQRGRAAGLRTMFLVCTGSALAMIAAHWMYISEGGIGGDNNASRIAQGILAGMGFLGAGAIIRKGNLVRGVTTAASLWYVTILGLTFGSGCYEIGLIAWGFALLALFGLPHLEWHLMEDRYSTVIVIARAETLMESEV